MHFLAELLTCLRFFSRLPVPATLAEAKLGANGLAHAVAFVPVAGVIIAIVPGAILLTSITFGLSPLLAAPLAIAALVAVTGCLHEDGLADCADGFGGGVTRERKLEIMRDSRIGTFGACAIALSLYLRAAALASIASKSPLLACAILMAAASLSRTASLTPLLLLPPARTDGLGATSGRPAVSRFAVASAFSAAVSFTMLAFGASPGQVATAIVLVTVAALAVSALAWRQIGGQTGDVAGATQQITEIVVLLAFAAG